MIHTSTAMNTTDRKVDTAQMVAGSPAESFWSVMMRYKQIPRVLMGLNQGTVFHGLPLYFFKMFPEEPVGELSVLDSPDIDEVAVVGIHFVGLPIDKFNPVFRIRFDTLELAEVDRKCPVFHSRSLFGFRA